jgi:flap endonuclease-1
MGIEGLSDILKELPYSPYQILPLTQFGGKRIAIDFYGWIYSNLSKCQEDVIMKMTDPLQPVDRQSVMKLCISNLTNFIVKICQARITPIFIFDGETLADKILHAKVRRDKDKEKNKKEVDVLRLKLENSHPLARNQQDVKTFKMKLSKILILTQEDMSYLRTFIINNGLPCLTAKDEAEKLCAALSREGITIASWTNDSDSYVFSAPLTIKGFEGYKDGVMTVKVVFLPYILYGLQMDQEQFIELAIMLQCDFNTRIPRKGPKTVLPLIKQYKTIENCMQVHPDWNWPLLNHIRCREIFKYEPSGIDGSLMKIDKTKAIEPIIKNAFLYVPDPSNTEYTT